MLFQDLIQNALRIKRSYTTGISFVRIDEIINFTIQLSFTDNNIFVLKLYEFQ